MSDDRDSVIAKLKALSELAEYAELNDDPMIQDCAVAAAISGNAHVTRALETYLRVPAAQRYMRGFPFRTPRPEQLWQPTRGEPGALVGRVQDTTLPFILPIEGFSRVLVLGATGTGKTNLLIAIALQLMGHRPVWLFDRLKQDYRHLLRVVPDLMVLDAQRTLHFNPLAVPDGVHPQHHLAMAVEVFCKVFGLLDASQAMLRKVLYELYRRLGVFDGSRNYPTIRNAREAVAALILGRRYRSQGYQDSILNRLDACMAECPDTYDVVQGFPIEALARKSFVLELKGLSEQHGRFLVSSLLLTLFLYRIAHHLRGSGLQNLIIVDEARWLAPPGYNEAVGFSPFSVVLGQGREAGLGLIAADQTADLEKGLFEQSRTKIAFALGDGRDRLTAGQAMGLTDEQIQYIRRLGVGEAIVSIPECDPFVIHVPKTKLG